ncbi:unnamed protein product [Closterium sp. NIES-64]|nr:unnamed protein product [Closterium sp. NIES-64]
MASLLAPAQAQMSSLSLAASRSQNALSSSASVSFRGAAISAPRRVAATATPSAVAVRAQASADAATQERFRLNNLAPQPGSRRQEKRKGRGHAAGQGASCGFGMRGQKSRSGPGVRHGFEGGQMPLYRRLPKLKGIAGGMGAGLPKYVTLNVGDLEEMGLEEGEEVSLESLVEDGILNPSGRDRRLPLKILGDGEISTKVTIKAASFSEAAREKLEAAGCTLEVSFAMAACRLHMTVTPVAGLVSSTVLKSNFVACPRVLSGPIRSNALSASNGGRRRFVVHAHKVEVEHQGKTHILEIPEDETILSAAIDAGLDLPHDCKLGVCMTCPAKLISGEVDQSEGMLSDDVMEQGYALMCASYPKSDCKIRVIPEEELLSLQLVT